MITYYKIIIQKLSSYNLKRKFLWIWPVNPLTRKFFYTKEAMQEFIKINEHGY